MITAERAVQFLPPARRQFIAYLGFDAERFHAHQLGAQNIDETSGDVRIGNLPESGVRDQSRVIFGGVQVVPAVFDIGSESVAPGRRPLY